MLEKRYSATTYGAIYLSLILVISAMAYNYEEPAIAQITPTSSPANSGNHQNTDDGDTPVSDDDLTAIDPITPNGPTSSNLTESPPPLNHKYISTPHPTGPSHEETLVGKIFNKVNEDLKASGITGIYP